MKLYKTEWCPKKGQHDRAACVYAHNVQFYLNYSIII